MLRFCASLFVCLAMSLATPLRSAATSISEPTIGANENRTSAGHLENGVLTLHLELRRGVWHPQADDGRAMDASVVAEEGRAPQTPGPLIRAPQGTEINVSIHNELTSAAFVHGLHSHPAKADDYTEVAAGETKQVRFAAGEPGSYLYWATTTKEAPIADDLMSGAFIVDKPGATVTDRIFVIQLWVRDLYQPTFNGALAINGKSWPYTERLDAELGQPEHWRILNASPIEHPMHLHGFFFHVDAVGDGETEQHYSEAERRMAVTELLPPGHSFDMTWLPERAGNWIFHCHILDHMMAVPMAPWLWGPTGPPAGAQQMRHDDPMGMGMGALVMGITVTDNHPQLVPAKATLPALAIKRDLFVRERKASAYVPAGPGFYLEGVSKEVGAAGPPLVLTRGERSAITVHNELDEPTAIHWHGVEIESYYDGVPGIGGTPQHATPYIRPGESFVAYITPPRAGTFIYHTHWRDTAQLTSGMYGALVVLEPGQKYDPVTDKAFVLGRSGPDEFKDPMVLNGSPQPGLIVLLPGQKYRLRLVNITPNDAHVDASLLTNGHPVKWRAIAKDGADLPPQQATERDASQIISVGETYDFEFSPSQPGDYELRFASDFGNVVTQMIAVVPEGSPFSTFAAKR